MKKKKLILLLCCSLAAGKAEAHDIISSRYSYREHVLPILEAHCVRCHSPDGPAPFRLTSYRDARPQAVAIKEEVLLRNMPPWYAEEGQHKLIGEHRLSAAEVDIIVEWASGGAPEGKRTPGGNTPGTIKPPEVADLELELPEQILLPGKQRETVRLTIETGLSETAWITGWELGGARADLLRSGSLYRVRIAPENYLGTRMTIDGKLSWGAGAKLEAGEDLALSILYTRPWTLGDKRESVRGRLRIWLSKTRPKLLLHARALGETHSLPPGSRLFGVLPSTPMKLKASGETEDLIEVFAAPGHWPLLYRFNETLKISGKLEVSPKTRGIVLYTTP